MQGKEIQPVMEYGRVPNKGSQAPKKEQAVIVTIPPEVKRYLMFLVLSNSVIWILFGFGAMGFEEDREMWTIIISSGCILWVVGVIPFFVHFITKINWGQRGG